MMIIRYLFLLVSISVLLACSTGENYRGVPKEQWDQLTPDQKQLIVDDSFKNEFDHEV
jgi:hypothetical protein